MCEGGGTDDAKSLLNRVGGGRLTMPGAGVAMPMAAIDSKRVGQGKGCAPAWRIRGYSGLQRFSVLVVAWPKPASSLRFAGYLAYVSHVR